MAFHVDPVQPWTPVHTVPEWHRNLKSWYVIDRSLAASLDPFPPGGEGGGRAPLLKPYRNHRSQVWTEALCNMVFVSAQKLSGNVWR